MDQEGNTKDISVTWRGKKYVLNMNLGATVEELGHELQKLTAEISIAESKPICMMGVPKEEIDQVLKNEKMDMKIAGFDEEEKRIRQRISNGFDIQLKLPQGNYVFGDFKTLDLSGIKLHPPPSEALRLMHTLAADRGIVAIMNKHKWCVGIMTKMAPEGYVGVSHVCIFGLNKNHGEEISLRLRTDDLKGSRKYQIPFEQATTTLDIGQFFCIYNYSLLNQLEFILESDSLIDEVGFVHPSQFVAISDASAAIPTGMAYFWSKDHKLTNLVDFIKGSDQCRAVIVWVWDPGSV